MKRIFFIIPLLLLLLVVDNKGYSQNADELLRQKATQRKYLLKQIALLKVYLRYLKEGYKIAEQGLTIIGDIKDGDFSLHKDYFGSLKNVNVHLSSSSQVAEVFTMQVHVIRGIINLNAFCRSSTYFTSEEVHYIERVYSNMLVLTENSMSQLLTIITSGETEMTDDDRLNRIAGLHQDMREKSAFVQFFSGDVRMLAAEREREKNSLDFLAKQLHLAEPQIP